MLPFKVNPLKIKEKQQHFYALVLPSSLGVLDMPVIMAFTGERECCLPSSLLLKHLSQVFEFHLQANAFGCCTSTALAGVQLSKG